MANAPGLTEAEMEVLRALWDCGPATVRDLNQVLEGRGRRWAYTTVATLLHRLAVKGFIASSTAEVPHTYRAAVSREQLLESRLKDAADEFCDGNAAPLVLALVKGNRFTTEELARFYRLLAEASDRAEQGGPGRLPRGRRRSGPEGA